MKYVSWKKPDLARMSLPRGIFRPAHLALVLGLAGVLGLRPAASGEASSVMAAARVVGGAHAVHAATLAQTCLENLACVPSSGLETSGDLAHEGRLLPLSPAESPAVLSYPQASLCVFALHDPQASLQVSLHVPTCGDVPPPPRGQLDLLEEGAPLPASGGPTGARVILLIEYVAN